MTRSTILYACVLLMGVFISAISQVMLKKAAQKKKKERKNDRISYKSYARQGKRKQTV